VVANENTAATTADLCFPSKVVVSCSDEAYIADGCNNHFGVVSTSGIICMFAGACSAGYLGDGSPTSNAEQKSPTDILVFSHDHFYIADTFN
jgi:hypothetical protein